MRSKVIDAAKAASDVGAFALAAEILGRGHSRLCVICFRYYATSLTISFKGDALPVCQSCQEKNVGNIYGMERRVHWITRDDETFHDKRWGEENP